jgi:hypothetical protein
VRDQLGDNLARSGDDIIADDSGIMKRMAPFDELLNDRTKSRRKDRFAILLAPRRGSVSGNTNREPRYPFFQ